MKGLFGIAVVVLFCLTAAPSAAAENVTINLSVCDADGGEETVPAGATLVLQETWADTRSAHVRRFLRLQDTTASVNNAPVANASSLWGPVAQEGSQYVTTWSYNTGVTLSAGESLQVAYDTTFTKHFRDGSGTAYEPGSSVYGGPISCRITAS